MTQPAFDPVQLAMQSQTPPGAAPAGGLGGAGGDPSMPAMPSQQPQPYGMGPTGPAGADQATDQVIWQAFPSTDPSQVGQLMQQMGPVQGMAALEQQFHADQDALYQRYQQTLQMVVGQLQQPDQAAAPPPGPGVGGENVGF